MGFLNWFSVESIVFELLITKGALGLRFVKRSHGIITSWSGVRE